MASLLAMLLFASFDGQAQFSVEPIPPGWTAQQLVDSMLKGDGVQITNAKFNRSSAVIQGSTSNCIGIFHNLHLFNASDYLSRPEAFYPSGIIMTTGAISKATTSSGNVPATPSNRTADGVAFDNDLVGVTTGGLKSLTLLEFDFVSNSALVQFNYIFASVEYPSYVFTGYNDVFAFHISGLDPVNAPAQMKRNIALIPNTIFPVTINTVNNGNSGQGGTASTMSPSAANPEYFFDNRSSAYTNTIKYGGFTVDLVASAIIVSCYNQPYHMSLSIADVSDNDYQSAMFLKKGSFKSPEILIGQTSEIANNDTILAECNPVFIDFRLPQPNTRPVSSSVHGLGITDGATAFRGVHYEIYEITDTSENLLIGSSVSFDPASVIKINDNHYEFDGADTLIKLKVKAIPGAILPGEVKIAKIYTTVDIGGGGLAVMCQEPAATDTMIIILKGYEKLKLSADSVFNSCDQYQGALGLGVEKGFLKSVRWEGPTDLLLFNGTDSLNATLTAPLTDTTIFTLIATDIYGCSMDTSHIQINIPTRPIAAIQSNVTEGCSPFKFSPSSISTYDTYLRWVAPDGQTSAMKNPTFTINTDDMVWLYAYSADYCYDSTFIHVKVYDRPHADFTYLPFEPLNGRPIEFYNASTGDDPDYRWNFGDGTTSIDVNPIHTYHVGNSEIFNVQLITTVGAIDNCADTTLQQIPVEDRYAYYVPAGFTPNEDGINDLFTPFLTDVFDYSFMIYDRWGSLIFYSNDISSGWDGNDKNGKECESGVYVWKINFKKYVDPNALLEYKGTLTLVR
jgi:gliding motility-associated-like protein